MITFQKYTSRDEWLELRKGSVGGSEAGAIMGVSEYASPYTIWCEKTGRVKRFAGNNATRLGTELEDHVARRFCELQTKLTGKSVRVRRNRRIIRNTEYPFAHANVDREVVGQHAVLECKTTAGSDTLNREDGREYPEMWYWQVVHYMAVGGYNYGWLAVLDRTGRKPLRVFRVERNEADIEKLMKKEAEFIEQLRNDIQPEMIGIAREAEINKERWRGDSNTSAVTLPPLWEPRLTERAQLKAEAKRIEKEITALDAGIQSEMGDAEKGVCGEYSLSWKEQFTSGIDREAISRDFPTLCWEKYKTRTRVLRVSKRKEKTKDKPARKAATKGESA